VPEQLRNRLGRDLAHELDLAAAEADQHQIANRRDGRRLIRLSTRSELSEEIPRTQLGTGLAGAANAPAPGGDEHDACENEPSSSSRRPAATCSSVPCSAKFIDELGVTLR